MNNDPERFDWASELARRKAFFFAEEEAGMYDVGPDLNTPLYSLAHATLQELVRTHLVSADHSPSGYFLDIGSGTGTEAIPLLERYPQLKVIALDLCPPMHRELESNVRARIGVDAWHNRCLPVVGDIAELDFTAEHILAQAGLSKGQKILFAISGFTLHHLSLDQKRRVFHKLATLIDRGGLFVNVDLYSFQSPTLAKQAMSFLVRWIERQHTTPDPELQDQFEALGSRRDELKNAWIHHVTTYNHPLPVESRSDSLAQGFAAGTEGEAEMLLEAGFSEVACPMRFWQVGVVWALK